MEIVLFLTFVLSQWMLSGRVGVSFAVLLLKRFTVLLYSSSSSSSSYFFLSSVCPSFFLRKERKKECFACCVHSPCTPCIQYIQHTYTHRGGLFFCFKENKKEGKGKKLDFSGFVDPASEQ